MYCTHKNPTRTYISRRAPDTETNIGLDKKEDWPVDGGRWTADDARDTMMLYYCVITLHKGRNVEDGLTWISTYYLNKVYTGVLKFKDTKKR